MQTSVSVSVEDGRIAALAVLAISLHILEGAFPSPLPGVKPGISNIITIMVLCQAGWGWAAWVSLLRVLVGSVVLGTFLSPTFVLSLTGAVTALTGLGIAVIWSRQVPVLKLGAVGYSIVASVFHIGGQILTAYVLFIPHAGLFKLLPILGGAALLFGALNGVISYKALELLKN